MWCLIASIPDLCPFFFYFYKQAYGLSHEILIISNFFIAFDYIFEMIIGKLTISKLKSSRFFLKKIDETMPTVMDKSK